MTREPGDGRPGRSAALVALLDQLPLFVAAQACLLFYDLDRLPLWGDEYATLVRAALAPADLVAALSGNVHPPLYFLLVHYWMMLPWPGSPIAQARAFSAVTVLVALVAFDRLWLREADARTRRWFLALWALSPFLLLYSRMARSYSLQLLLAVLALRAGWSLVQRPRSAALVAAFALFAAALAYTHYLPALAIGAAVGFALLRGATRERDVAPLFALLASATLVALLYAPWLLRLREAVGLVLERGPVRVTGGAFDLVTALAYTFVSVSFGEALPVTIFVAAAAVAPALLLLLWRGARSPVAEIKFVAPAAAVAFAGATRWVSAAFVAPRLAWFFPFYLLWLLAGRARMPRLGNLVCAALLGLSIASTFAYFARAGFLNRAYVLPVEEIAARIRERSPEGGYTVVLIDHVRTNLQPLLLLLPPQADVALLEAGSSADQIRAIVSSPPPAVVWLVASSRNDLTLRWMAAVRSGLGGQTPPAIHLFAPRSRLELFLLDWLGESDPPSHAMVMWELRP